MTLVAFLAFAVTFFFARVLLNSGVTYLYLREVYYSLSGPPGSSALVYSPAVQLFIAVNIVAGWAMQMNWAMIIARKIAGAVRGETGEEKAAAKKNA